MFGSDGVDPLNGPIPASSLFGVTTTSTMQYIPYGARMDLKLLIPEAVKTSGYYRGCMSVQSFSGSSPGISTDALISVSNLITAAESFEDINKIHISAATQSNYVLSFSPTQERAHMGTYSTSVLDVFEYIIIPKPAIPLTAVGNLTYSVVAEISYHTVVLASARDPILYKILTPKGIYYHKSMLADVPLLGFKGMVPPKNI